MKVLRWDAERDGPLSEDALRRKLQAHGYCVTRYEYPPGTRFPAHTHEIDKIDAVVSGAFRLTLPEGSVVLGPGDALTVPAGTTHSAEVVGTRTVVSLDAVRIQ